MRMFRMEYTWRDIVRREPLKHASMHHPFQLLQRNDTGNDILNAACFPVATSSRDDDNAALERILKKPGTFFTSSVAQSDSFELREAFRE